PAARPARALAAAARGAGLAGPRLGRGTRSAQRRRPGSARTVSTVGARRRLPGGPRATRGERLRMLLLARRDCRRQRAARAAGRRAALSRHLRAADRSATLGTAADPRARAAAARPARAGALPRRVA